jgi:hypothetical protein
MQAWPLVTSTKLTVAGAVDRSTPVAGAVDRANPVAGAVDRATPVAGAVDRATPVAGAVDRATPAAGAVNRVTPVAGQEIVTKLEQVGASAPAVGPTAGTCQRTRDGVGVAGTCWRRECQQPTHS